ncbi:MAG: helix-turn-helix domain-containing protein [Alphaproteobacteria bacterium]
MFDTSNYLKFPRKSKFICIDRKLFPVIAGNNKWMYSLSISSFKADGLYKSMANNRESSEHRFGAALAKVIHQYRMRQDHLAQKAGMTKSRLSNIKNQRGGMRIENALKLIDCLPDKAKMKLYSELFGMPEIEILGTKCRERGHNTEMSLKDFVETIPDGECFIIRKVPRKTPKRSR